MRMLSPTIVNNLDPGNLLEKSKNLSTNQRIAVTAGYILILLGILDYL